MVCFLKSKNSGFGRSSANWLAFTLVYEGTFGLLNAKHSNFQQVLHHFVVTEITWCRHMKITAECQESITRPRHSCWECWLDERFQT